MPGSSVERPATAFSASGALAGVAGIIAWRLNESVRQKMEAAQQKLAALSETDSLTDLRNRRKAMADGVTLVAPDTVWFAHDTEVGRDCVIGHNVVLHGCTIKDRVLGGMGAILMDGVVIGEDCVIGPNTTVLR